jgi:hypothetical protein
METSTRIVYIEAESTDMFNCEDGWQFNYCWCNRTSFAVPAGCSRASVTRKAKAKLGLSGLRCQDLWRCGDEVAQRISKSCVGFNWRVVC